MRSGVPPALIELLGALADGRGLLPPWTDWWDEVDTVALFPGPASRAAVEREQSRLPLAYFEGSLDVPAGWDDRPCGYLSGDTYADERADAVRQEWPVSTLPGGHLHAMHDPDHVADAIVGVLHRVHPAAL